MPSTESAIDSRSFTGAPPVNTTSTESQQDVKPVVPNKAETPSADRENESSFEGNNPSEASNIDPSLVIVSTESSPEGVDPEEFTTAPPAGTATTTTESAPESPDPQEFPFNLPKGNLNWDPADLDNNTIDEAPEV